MDIVVAHYMEDLEWLPVVPEFNYYIYSKNPEYDYGPLLKKHSKINIIKLPNVGRESHTYLHHIINNYARLKTSETFTTLFIQGKISDHAKFYQCCEKDTIVFMNKLIIDAVIFGKSQSTAKAWDFKSLGAHADFKITGPGAQQVDLTLGKWFYRNFGVPFPESARWWVGALFAIRNDFIVSQSKKYFENIYNQLDHPNPEIGHFLERSWFYLFNCPLPSTTTTISRESHSAPLPCCYGSRSRTVKPLL